MALRCLLLLLCALVGASFAEIGQPECRPFNSTLAGSAGSLCGLYPGMGDGVMFFVPNNDETSTYEALHEFADSVLTAMRALTNVPVRCRDILYLNFCALVFRPCVMEAEELFVFPVQPCRWFCTELLDECAAYGAKTGFPYRNLPYRPPNIPSNHSLTCNETDAHNNYGWLYEHAFYSAEIAPNVTVQLQCNDFNGTFIDEPCAKPLELNPENQFCAFPCPLDSYTESEYDAAKTMQAVLGWFSWSFTLFMIASYLVNPQLRAFPSNLVIMTAISLHVVALGIVMPSIVGHTRTWCGEDTQYTKQPSIQINFAKMETKIDYDITDLQFASGVCSFQGALLHFGLVSATFWWFIIAVNMFIQTFFVVTKVFPALGNKRNKLIMQAVYAAVGWGAPFFLMLIPTAAGKMVFSAGATFCFLSPEDDYAWQIAFWFVPVGLVLVVGSLFFAAGMAQVLRLCVMSMRDRSSKTVRRATPLFVRLLMFVFIFWLLYICIFAYRIVVAHDTDSISDAYNDYMVCLSLGGVPNNALIGNVNCDLGASAKNFELAMVQGFSISSLGIFLMLAFVSVEMFAQWGRIAVTLVKGIAKRNENAGVFSSLFHVLKSGTTTSTNTSKTGSKMTITSHVTTANEDDYEEDEEGDGELSETSSSSSSANNGEDEEVAQEELSEAEDSSN